MARIMISCGEPSGDLYAGALASEILRLAPDPDALGPSSDDLLALADAVREAARPLPPREDAGQAVGLARETGREVGRRGHLRVLRSPDS